MIYANKEHIDSWINVITLSGSKIVTVTCGAIHLAENPQVTVTIFDPDNVITFIHESICSLLA